MFSDILTTFCVQILHIVVLGIVAIAGEKPSARWQPS